MAAIGIDLGTTYSCVATYEHGKVEIIANNQGNRTMPSYVAFTDEELLVGEAAANQIGLNPQNTIFDVKRMLGKKMSDPLINEDIRHWPFKVINKSEEPCIEVMSKRTVMHFGPEQISSMVLKKLKNTAEEFLGKKVTGAVITIPAYFGHDQRKATERAAELADLKVLRLVSEPTAATIAYGFQKKVKSKSVMVFDMGGGTCDVSIIVISHGKYHVKAVAGNTHLGGEDFDLAMVKHFVEDFKKKHRRDLSSNVKSMSRLRKACEQAKRTLSSQDQTRLNVDSLFDGLDYTAKITRSKFEQMTKNFMNEAEKHVKQALQNAKMDQSEIDEVVLVGGSSRIPQIQNILKQIFDNKRLSKAIHPDEAVAFGAAVFAAKLSGIEDPQVTELQLDDDVERVTLPNSQFGSRLSRNSGRWATPRMHDIHTSRIQNRDISCRNDRQGLPHCNTVGENLRTNSEGDELKMLHQFIEHIAEQLSYSPKWEIVEDERNQLMDAIHTTRHFFAEGKDIPTFYITSKRKFLEDRWSRINENLKQKQGRDHS